MSENDAKDPEEAVAGVEPTEEVGPDRAQVGPIDCEQKVQELEAKPHECQTRPIDEIQEAYVPNPKTTTADDGMPYDGDPNVDLPEAPPFTYDNVVCIADDRTYVEMFSDELPASQLLTMNAFAVADSYSAIDGVANVRRQFESSAVAGEAFGIKYVVVEEKKIPVRPIRERCIHFREQMFANDDQTDPTLPGHRILFRNCAARRSVGGAALSVRDEAVFACSWRHPRDLASEERYLNSFNRKLLAESADQKTHLPLIDD